MVERVRGLNRARNWDPSDRENRRVPRPFSLDISTTVGYNTPMITLVANGPQARLVGPLDAAIHQALYLQMSWPHARAIYHPETLQSWDDGRIGIYYPRSGRFPTGCIPRVLFVLDQLNIPYEVHRALPPENTDLSPTGQLYDYQEEMLAAALLQPYGILHAPPRSGKTAVGAHWIATLNRSPAAFLVNAIDLCHQAREELAKWLDCEVGLIGDGIYEPSEITVVSVQSAFSSLKRTGKAKSIKWKDPLLVKEKPLPNHEEAVAFLERVVVRVVDEVHAATAPSHQQVYKAMLSCCFSLGLSATPWSEDNNGVLMEAACGSVVHKVGYNDLIAAGRLVPPTIEVYTVTNKRYPRAFRYPTIYTDYIVDNEERNNAIVRFCERMKEENHTTIVFVYRIRHAKALAERMDAVLVTGSITGKVREKIWDRLRARKIPIIVATVGKEGLNIPVLDAVVIGGGGQSATQALQAMPRVMTAIPGKDHAHVLDFYDQARHLRGHSKRRIGLYGTEEAFTVVQAGAKITEEDD